MDEIEAMATGGFQMDMYQRAARGPREVCLHLKKTARPGTDIFESGHILNLELANLVILSVGSARDCLT